MLVINNEMITISTYNLDYLIHDLQKILFNDTNNKPWNDNKSDKRCRRLLVCILFKSLYLGLDKYINQMKLFEKYVFDIWKGYSVISENRNIGQIQKVTMILNLQNDVAATYNKLIQDKNNPYEDLVEALDVTLQIIVLSAISDPNNFDANLENEIEKATQFLNIILDNFDKLFSIAKALLHFGVTTITSSNKNIYTAYLGGGQITNTNINEIARLDEFNNYNEFLYNFVNY
jgi:hypothetical protein